MRVRRPDPGGIISERRATSRRNRGRDHLRMKRLAEEHRNENCRCTLSEVLEKCVRSFGRMQMPADASACVLLTTAVKNPDCITSRPASDAPLRRNGQIARRNGRAPLVL